MLIINARKQTFNFYYFKFKLFIPYQGSLLLFIKYSTFYNALTMFFISFSEEYLLEDAKNYRFLSCGGLAVPGVDDALEFHNTVSAMNIMGLSPEDLSC